MYFVHTNAETTCPQIEVGQNSACAVNILQLSQPLIHRTAILDFEVEADEACPTFISGCVQVETAGGELGNVDFPVQMEHTLTYVTLVTHLFLLETQFFPNPN